MLRNLMANVWLSGAVRLQIINFTKNQKTEVHHQLNIATLTLSKMDFSDSCQVVRPCLPGDNVPSSCNLNMRY